MKDESFNRVTEFCSSKSKSVIVRNYVYCLFQEELHGALKQHQNPTEDIMTTVANTLLTPESLAKNIAIAEQMIGAAYRDVMTHHYRKSRWGEFWLATIASVLGAILYSVLLLLFFVLAKDQIGSWLHSVEGDERQPSSKIQVAVPSNISTDIVGNASSNTMKAGQ